MGTKLSSIFANPLSCWKQWIFNAAQRGGSNNSLPVQECAILVSAPKPFMEFSFTMRQSEHSSVVQIKYLHLLVQEFSVQVDQGLINALLALFTNEAELKPYTVCFRFHGNSLAPKPFIEAIISYML